MKLSPARFLFCIVLCCSYSLIPANAQSQSQRLCSIKEPLFRNYEYQEWWNSFIVYVRLAKRTPSVSYRTKIARFETARQIANRGFNVPPYTINNLVLNNHLQEDPLSIAYMLSYVSFVKEMLNYYATQYNEIRPVEYQTPRLSASDFRALRQKEYQDALQMYKRYHGQYLSPTQKQELLFCVK